MTHARSCSRSRHASALRHAAHVVSLQLLLQCILVQLARLAGGVHCPASVHAHTPQELLIARQRPQHQQLQLCAD